MWNFFKSKQAVPTVYTAEEIHTAINAIMVDYLSKATKEYELTTLQQQSELQCLKVKNLGFTRSKNAEHYNNIASIKKMYKEQRELLDMLERTRRFFPKAIYVPYKNFFEILEKYNLVCGIFEDFKGVIPDDKIDEIKEACDFFNTDDTSNKFKNIAATYLSREQESKALSVSELLKLKDVDYEHIHPITQDVYDSMCKIESAILQVKSDMFQLYKITGVYRNASISPVLQNKIKRFPFYTDNDNAGDSNFPLVSSMDIEYRYRSRNRLFICAPAQEMLTNIKFLDKVKSEDPFICSASKHGVFIYSKWGEEANDAMIKHFAEELDAISKLVH